MEFFTVELNRDHNKLNPNMNSFHTALTNIPTKATNANDKISPNKVCEVLTAACLKVIAWL